jgi:hypothetical protein
MKMKNKDGNFPDEGLMKGVSDRATAGLVLDEAALKEAQKGLVERPTMNIRTKIIMGFSFLFILCAAASITYLIMGGQVDKKIRLMETLNNYSFEIQQARRYEKNFFLYKTNLPDALETTQNAREILKKEGKNITAVISQEKLNLMLTHLSRYESLLGSLRGLIPGSAENPVGLWTIMDGLLILTGMVTMGISIRAYLSTYREEKDIIKTMNEKLHPMEDFLLQ